MGNFGPAGEAQGILRLFDPSAAAAARSGSVRSAPPAPAPTSPQQQQTESLATAASILARWVPQAVTTRDLANLYIEAGETSSVYVKFYRLLQTVAAGKSTTAIAPTLPGIVQQLWVPPGSALMPLSAVCTPASDLVTVTITLDNSIVIENYPMGTPVGIDTPQVVRDGLERTYTNDSSEDVSIEETIALLNIEKGQDFALFAPFARLQIGNIVAAVAGTGGGGR